MAIMLIGVATSCEDERFVDPSQEEIPYGVTSIGMNVGFMPMNEALNDEGSRANSTVAPAGDAMKDLVDMVLLFYDKDGNLVKTFSETDFKNFKVSDLDRTDADVPGKDEGMSGVVAESMTKRASFKLNPVEFGRYYIYAVANLGRWNGETATTTTLQEIQTTYKEDVKTITGLRDIKLKWDPDNYRNNRQMLGFMAVQGTSQDIVTRKFDAPLLVINKNNMQLHAWLKRAASKVTITFDGSGLRENIRVYLRRAKIYDIADECALGNDNTVTDQEGLAQSHHVFYYGEGEDYKTWPSITAGAPKLDESLASHDEKAKALYFYENRQGDFTNHPDRELYDKRQWPADDGTVLDSKDKKDNVPFGTYIEVEGYYVARATDYVSNGKIIYRFMLGQDIYYNFDATRNCHYKLTLKFRGNANDVDWHIEYGEDYPQIYLPEKYYISYLYNRQMQMPLRITCGSAYDLVSLDAEILCNKWSPSIGGREDKPGTYNDPATTGDYKFTWNQSYYVKRRLFRPKNYPYINEAGHVEAPNSFDLAYYNSDIEAGFLALHQTFGEGNDGMEILSDVTDKTSAGSLPKDSTDRKNTGWKLYNYWKENYDDGKRHYEVPSSKGAKTYDQDIKHLGSYRVVRDDSTFTYSIPMYTRAKQMSPWLAYSANNPYPYPRHAVVRFTATFKDKISGDIVKRSRRVVVEQVERIQNPKGVWRRWNNETPFEIKLLKRDPDDFSSFLEIESEGPWRAEVAVGKDWIKLNDQTNHIVQGSSGSKIKFTYKPDGDTGGSDKVRSGVIRVLYNNYTCTHLIFVRQGYEAEAIVPGGEKWSVYNLYDKENLVKSPLASGSYFRCGNLDDAIRQANNTTYPRGIAVGDSPLELTNKDAQGNYVKKTWNKIPCYRSQDLDANSPLRWTEGRSTAHPDIPLGSAMFKDLTINGKGYRVAGYDDYHALLEKCDMGYGNLYADGATTTAMDEKTAFHFEDKANTITDSSFGMRGVFAYDKNTGKQIFFPISSSGYGRRKAWISEGSGNNGVLRYGDLKYRNADWNPASGGDPSNAYRVMIYDLNQTPGAMYWLRDSRKDGHVEGDGKYNSFSWDMNYAMFGFGTYHRFVFYNNSRGSDALLIKLIKD